MAASAAFLLSRLHVRVREIHRWRTDANVFENLGSHIAQPVDFLLCKTHDIARFKRNFLIVSKQENATALDCDPHLFRRVMLMTRLFCTRHDRNLRDRNLF